MKTIREGMDLIEQGTKEKHVAETKLNLDSSRSHTMCTFNLVRTRTFAKEILATCRIVDLAGSERASRTEVTGERTAEAGAINTDLLYLMQCLRTMVDLGKTNQRMFFRNCKLTHLLSVGLAVASHADVDHRQPRGPGAHDHQRQQRARRLRRDLLRAGADHHRQVHQDGAGEVALRSPAHAEWTTSRRPRAPRGVVAWSRRRSRAR